MKPSPKEITVRTLEVLKRHAVGTLPYGSTIELALVEAFVAAAGGFDAMHAQSCLARTHEGPCLVCFLMESVQRVGSQYRRGLCVVDVAELLHATLTDVLREWEDVENSNAPGRN